MITKKSCCSADGTMSGAHIIDQLFVESVLYMQNTTKVNYISKAKQLPI